MRDWIFDNQKSLGLYESEDNFLALDWEGRISASDKTKFHL